MRSKEQGTKSKHSSLFAVFRRTSYRLRQLGAALGARISDDERQLVAQRLGEGERRLFERMARFDQRHCLDVYRTLVRAGHGDPLLLRAALIHDCGKVADDGRTIPLVYYGIFVLLKKLAPALYSRAASDGRGLLWPFAVHALHEDRGARLADLAGSPPELVAILRDYAARRATGHTAALLWADEQH
jgi:hypothetical protein